MRKIDEAIKISLGIKEERKEKDMKNELKVIEYRNIRVLTTIQIAEAYETEPQVITNNYNRNKERYVEGKHFICLTGNEKVGFINKNQNDFSSFVKAKAIYLWTEKGTFLHAKSLNTDKAWEVYDHLVDTYFRMKEEKKYKEIKKTMTEEKQAELEIKKMRAEAMQINAKTRAFKELKETLPKEKLSNVAMEVFGIKFLEDITGKNMGSQLPQVEVTYSATEIGNKFGVSPNKIGRIAKEYNLKTEEYGITVMDKVRHSSKEIPNFRYNEKAVKRFKEILNQTA